MKLPMHLGAIIDHRLVKKKLPGHVRSRSYDVIRGTASGPIFTKCVPKLEVFIRWYQQCLKDRYDTSYASWGKHWPSFGKKKLTRSRQVTEL